MSLFKKQRPQTRNPKVASEKPPVFSYSSARSAQKRPMNRGEDQKVANERPLTHAGSKISRAVNLVIIGCLVIGAFYLSILEPNGQIKISGEKVYPREKTSYEQEINRRLKSSIFNRSKLTFDGNKLAAEIKQEFPEIERIDINVPLIRHRPTIEVSLAKPTAKLVTAEQTYILDEQGRALFEQKDAASNLDVSSLLSINDASGHQIVLGKPALTEQQIGFIREVIGQLSAKGLQPQSFALSGGGTAVDVRLQDVAYFVKFSFNADPKQSSGALLAVRDQLAKDSTTPKEYVDLRIPEKAFTK